METEKWQTLVIFFQGEFGGTIEIEGESKTNHTDKDKGTYRLQQQTYFDMPKMHDLITDVDIKQKLVEFQKYRMHTHTHTQAQVPIALV